MENSLAATLDPVSEVPDHPKATVQDFLPQAGSNQDTSAAGDHTVVTEVLNSSVLHIKVETRKRFPTQDKQVLKDLAASLDPSRLPGTRDDIRHHGREVLDRLFRQIF